MKKQLFLFILLVVCFAFLFGCNVKEKEEDVAVDYSMYSFTDIAWERDAEHDIETICFLSNGSFRYYCACGNPVNDSDLCERYIYDDKTKTITLECFETTDEMITTFKIVKWDDKELHLDFDGDLRIFYKQS